MSDPRRPARAAPSERRRPPASCQRTPARARTRTPPVRGTASPSSRPRAPRRSRQHSVADADRSAGAGGSRAGSRSRSATRRDGTPRPAFLRPCRETTCRRTRRASSSAQAAPSGPSRRRAGRRAERSCGRRAGQACRSGESPPSLPRTRTRCPTRSAIRPRRVNCSGSWRAETRPENRDDDVGLGRLDDLRLEGRRGDERFVLPQHGLEHDASDVLALQPLDDAAGERALFEDVAGRGDEESQCLQRSVSWRAGSIRQAR